MEEKGVSLYFTEGSSDKVYLKERADVTREAAVVSQIVRIKPQLNEAVELERLRGG